MVETGLMDNVDSAFLLENKGIQLEKSTKARQLSNQARAELHQYTKVVQKSGDIALILTLEKRFLLNDLAHYVNSPSQASSIANALDELNGAQNTYQKVISPEAYKQVNEEHSTHKNRRGSLPIDQARQFFMSNANRILNWDKARLTDSEKAVLEARRQNMITAQKIYIGLQRQALGIEAKPPTKQQGLTR